MAEHSQCSKDVMLFDDLNNEIGYKKKRPEEAYLPKPGNIFLCNFLSRPLIANRFPRVSKRTNTNTADSKKKRSTCLIYEITLALGVCDGFMLFQKLCARALALPISFSAFF